MSLASFDIEYGDHTRVVANPLVSICMITYQHSAFIREAIDSVLMQNVPFSYELCIGEDGSTDGTRDICMEYARKYPEKIRLFLRDRKNPAREYFSAPYMYNSSSTFDACRGKYVALLEGDDHWLSSGKLNSQVQILESDSALAGCAHYAKCELEGHPWLGDVLPNYAIGSFAVDSLLRRDIGNLHTSTWLLRRGERVKWECFRTSMFGDYPIIVSTLLQGRATVIPRVWSAYRIHMGGVFSPLSDQVRLRENVNLWNCLREMVPPHMISSVNVGLVRTLIMQVGELSKSCEFFEAWACFRKALKTINNLTGATGERRGLRLLAFEALFCPFLTGIKRRCRKRIFRLQTSH